MAISALGSGLSGLQSYQQALTVSANNVANSLTPGFQPQRASFKETAPSGSSVSVESQTTPRASVASKDAPSQTDLASETVNQLTYSRGFEASANVVKTADSLIGTLLDAKA